MTAATVLGAVAVAEVIVALIAMVRLVRGPTVSDRIVALNTIASQCTLALLAFVVFVDRSVSLDIALWLASFSYLGTVIWSRYLERGLL